MTWVYDTSRDNWSLVQASGAPIGRFGHSLTYVPQLGGVLLFGGNQGGDETWLFTFANSTWRRIYAPDSPSFRQGHGATYSRVFGGVVLSGGGAEILNDTWLFDPGELNWILLSVSGPPPPRYYHSMAEEASTGLIVVTGGRLDGLGRDTWVFDPTTLTWSPKSVEVVPNYGGYWTSDSAMTYYEPSGRLVLVGGGKGFNTEFGPWYYDSTLDLWVLVDDGVLRLGRTRPAMVYDSINRVLIVNGGMYRQQGGYYTDGATWALKGDPSPGPPSVKSSSPEAGEKEAQRDSPVTIEFDREMDRSTFPGSVSISPGAGGLTISGTEQRMVITHSTVLLPGTLYTVRVSREARSFFGTPLAAEYVLTFATGSLPPPVPVVRPADSQAILTWTFITIAFLIAALAALFAHHRFALARRAREEEKLALAKEVDSLRRRLDSLEGEAREGGREAGPTDGEAAEGAARSQGVAEPPGTK
jgi:hypothetical protein